MQVTLTGEEYKNLLNKIECLERFKEGVKKSVSVVGDVSKKNGIMIVDGTKLFRMLPIQPGEYKYIRYEII